MCIAKGKNEGESSLFSPRTVVKLIVIFYCSDEQGLDLPGLSVFCKKMQISGVRVQYFFSFFEKLLYSLSHGILVRNRQGWYRRMHRCPLCLLLRHNLMRGKVFQVWLVMLARVCMAKAAWITVTSGFYVEGGIL